MATIYQNFMSGTLTADPGAAGVTIASSNLANLQVVSAPDTMWIVLDPDGTAGAPEIVQVTAHTASATTATVVRGQQGTTGRAHAIGTVWRAATTKSDLDELPFRKLTTTGDIIYASAANAAARLAIGASGRVLKSNGTVPSWGQIVNADVDPAAAIAYSKLALGTSIVNSDISASAAIAYSKLALTGAIVNTDISASAAIAYSKLALTNSIVNADVAAAAAIAYSKLNLSGSIVNADVSASAAIAYSKLALTSSIVNADVSASAAIAYSKLNLATSIVNGDISASAAIAYSKLALGNSIVNADISTAAAITKDKLSTATGEVAGAWTAFTPTWTNLTVGNGTNVGRYYQVGKTVHFSVTLTWGGTTSATTTGVVLTLPVAAQTNQPLCFPAIYTDGTVRYFGTTVRASTTTVTVSYNIEFAGEILSAITDTAPFTWASGDTIWINGTYEAA